MVHSIYSLGPSRNKQLLVHLILDLHLMVGMDLISVSRQDHNFVSAAASLKLSTGDHLSLNGRPLVSLTGSANPITEDRSQQVDRVSENTTDTLRLIRGSDADALVYLKRYGYMSPSQSLGSDQLVSEDSFSEAISSFQKFAGIPVTGHMDEKTELFMRMPRCGNSDKPITIRVATPLRLVSRRTGHKRGSLRRKRYALQGSKWRRQELTYRISQYPTRFNGKRHEVDSQIEKAFGIWSRVAPIDFVVKREGRVHIDIRFASGDHGDGDAFDGPGNTLAHAYFPQYGGDAHFDDQEYWTVDSYAGTNIFQVAAHELGHSLGLGHSNVREALMAPFYQKYKPNFKLHADDIQAIQALYGEKSVQPADLVTQPTLDASSVSSPVEGQEPSPNSSTTPHSPTARQWPSTSGHRGWTSDSEMPPNSRPTVHETNESDDSASPSSDAAPSGNPASSSPANGSDSSSSGEASGRPGWRAMQPADLCVDSKIDAITRTQDGSSYVFKGDHYWLLTSEGLAAGYPRRISQDWEGLPGQLDAALTWADGKSFFFKGNKYWRYRNKRRDLGYPKLISSGFSGIPDDIDAAFVWSGNGRTYIFKGGDYWRFDSKADPPVSSEYPRSIKVWSGLPLHVNAAFKWDNNVTYFFKGSQYYRFNDKDFRVETRGRPPFPRSSAEWWFGCPNSNLAQKALSSSLREAASVLSEAHQQDASDWSFYGGQNQTNIQGTHISDQRPSFGDQPPDETAIETSFGRLPPTASHSHHPPNKAPYDGYQTNSNRRIDLPHYDHEDRQNKPITTISSSAISNYIRIPSVALVVSNVILNPMLMGVLTNCRVSFRRA